MINIKDLSVSLSYAKDFMLGYMNYNPNLSAVPPIELFDKYVFPLTCRIHDWMQGQVQRSADGGETNTDTPAPTKTASETVKEKAKAPAQTEPPKEEDESAKVQKLINIAMKHKLVGRMTNAKLWTQKAMKKIIGLAAEQTDGTEEGLVGLIDVILKDIESKTDE